MNDHIRNHHFMLKLNDKEKARLKRVAKALEHNQSSLLRHLLKQADEKLQKESEG